MMLPIGAADSDKRGGWLIGDAGVELTGGSVSPLKIIEQPVAVNSTTSAIIRITTQFFILPPCHFFAE
jgi:hypothetical protein